MKKFLIFQRKEAKLGEDADMTPSVAAIPEEAIKVGIFVPGSHIEFLPDSVGEFEAETPEEAVSAWADARANAFL